MLENLNQFLELQFLENAVSEWLLFLLIILLSFIIRKFISNRVIGGILNIVNKDKIEGEFNKLLNKPINNIIFLIFLYIAFNQLKYPDSWNLASQEEFGLKMILNNGDQSVIKIYVLSSSPYEFSLSLIDKNKRDRIEFVNNQKDADFLVTNHYYQKNNPIEVNNKLKNKFKIFKEFKVDGMPINTIFKNN